MTGRIFLLNNGHIYVRDSAGREVNFYSREDFYKYYSKTIDLSGEFYIDYEPDKQVFFYRNNGGDFSALVNEYQGPIAEYDEIIADVRDMVDELADPYFGLTLKEAREYKLTEIKRQTYNTITRYLPEWKQIKWYEYRRLYEKKKAAGKLKGVEKEIFSSFPRAGETEASCFKKVEQGFSWIWQCVVANNSRETELAGAVDIAEIKKIESPDYPVFPSI